MFNTPSTRPARPGSRNSSLSPRAGKARLRTILIPRPRLSSDLQREARRTHLHHWPARGCQKARFLSCGRTRQKGWATRCVWQKLATLYLIDHGRHLIYWIRLFVSGVRFHRSGCRHRHPRGADRSRDRLIPASALASPSGIPHQLRLEIAPSTEGAFCWVVSAHRSI